jgi:hypothetical protein
MKVANLSAKFFTTVVRVIVFSSKFLLSTAKVQYGKA